MPLHPHHLLCQVHLSMKVFLSSTMLQALRLLPFCLCFYWGKIWTLLGCVVNWQEVGLGLSGLLNWQKTTCWQPSSPHCCSVSHLGEMGGIIITINTVMSLSVQAMDKPQSLRQMLGCHPCMMMSLKGHTRRWCHCITTKAAKPPLCGRWILQPQVLLPATIPSWGWGELRRKTASCIYGMFI